MVTISHIVTKLVDERIYLHEAISKRIASFGSVAKRLKPDIEKELGREVEHTAIVTALRRYSDKINTRARDVNFNSKYAEVNLKTHIIDINVLKTLKENQPMGIIKLSELTGYPQHMVRYSLRILEQDGLIEPSPHGAITTDEVGKTIILLKKTLENIVNKAEELKKNL
jgi:predicted transcriptional regulator